MQLVFTEEQEELRRAARAFLQDHSGSEQVRAAMASERGWDTEVWKRIATELGWTGVAIPETHGGAGLGFVELVALLEEMGEALLCAPFLSSVCMAAPALLAAPDCAASREWLPAIAEGRATATLATSDRFDAASIATVARKRGDGFVLAGESRFVLDGHTADLLLIAARGEGSNGDDGVSLFAVPASSAGVERRALPTMDQTRRFATVTLRDLPVGAASRVGGEGQGWPIVGQALDRAAIALAAEQVGGAQRCLDLSVAYAKERVQFGRPIGGFQAIKHKCADMMTAVESSRSAAYYAACVGDRGRRRAAQRRVAREGVVLRVLFPLRGRRAADPRRRGLHLGVRRAPAPEARALDGGVPRFAVVPPRARRRGDRAVIAIDLAGHVAIVTGGGRGVGRGISERLLEAGADVVICSRNEPESLPGAGGRTAAFVAADVRELEAIDRVIAFARDRFGRLDVLVNNAGGSPAAPAATASPRFSEKILQLNLIAPMHFAQKANAVMQSQPEGGVIVNIASVSALRPSPGTAAYAAAKAGLLSLTQTLAVEWAPRVRVNAIAAGMIKTELAAMHYGDEAAQARVAATVPLERLGTPRDVGDLCVFLASPLASYVSGAALLMHGGGERPAFLGVVGTS